MARLFIGPKEQQFIADRVKEITKDIIGQTIAYYAVSAINTQMDPVYDEAVRKVFERPIKLDCIVGQPEQSYTNSMFGLDQTTKIEVYVQPRDMMDKGVTLHTGDFFVYGTSIFEIQELLDVNNYFGQEEYPISWTIKGQTARLGQVDLAAFRHMLKDSKNFDESQVQKVFQQQRGLAETSENGATGDVRQLRSGENNQEYAPIALGEGPREIRPQDPEDTTSSFVHDSDSLYSDD